jgi:alcohol dehydrogenase (NADP+)
MFRSARSSVTPLSRISQISSHIQLQQQRNMASQTCQSLNNGAKIPAVGFGTWQDKDDQEKAVAEALKAGYRHIDTVCVPKPLNIDTC